MSKNVSPLPLTLEQQLSTDQLLEDVLTEIVRLEGMAEDMEDKYLEVLSRDLRSQLRDLARNYRVQLRELRRQAVAGYVSRAEEYHQSLREYADYIKSGGTVDNRLGPRGKLISFPPSTHSANNLED